jgi:hypothetical protein
VEQSYGKILVPITTLVPGLDEKGLKIHPDGTYWGSRPRAGKPVYFEEKGVPVSYIGYYTISIKQYPDVYEFPSQLKGQVLLDVGAGLNADGYRFAKMVGALAYIAIEGHYSGIIVGAILKECEEAADGNIPAAVIREDMLAALKRFPSNTVSVLAGGINRTLLREAADRYLKALENEVGRILHPKGILLSLGSDMSPPGCTIDYLGHPDLKFLRRYSKA